MIENLIQLEATTNLSDRMVSVRDFLEYLESTGQKAEIGPKMRLFEQLEEGPALPVTNVTWHEATDYCRWYNDQIPGAKARLPYEWELALAEHQARLLPPDSFWGAWPMKSKAEAARVLSTSGLQDWGMADTLGVACSWTSEGSASFRVYRGGSWCYTASFLRASFRFGDGPSNRFNGLGFRLAFN